MTINANALQTLPEGVGKLLEAWRTAWLTLDKHLMLSLFDANAPDFVYQAEEQAEPICDAAALQAYWDAGADTALAKIPAWDVHCQTVTVTDDLVAIFAIVNAELLINGLPGVIKGDIHVSLLVRKDHDHWRIFHYHEGRQVDPAMYLSSDKEMK